MVSDDTDEEPQQPKNEKEEGQEEEPTEICNRELNLMKEDDGEPEPETHTEETQEEEAAKVKQNAATKEFLKDNGDKVNEEEDVVEKTHEYL